MRLLSLWTVVAYLRTAPNANAQPMFMGIGDLPGSTFESRARAVSADGLVVVGGGRSASGREAFRWTASGGMVGLGDLPGGGAFWSGAAATSASRAVTGFFLAGAFFFVFLVFFFVFFSYFFFFFFVLLFFFVVSVLLVVLVLSLHASSY